MNVQTTSVLRAVEFIVAIQCIISSLEILSVHPILKDEGLLSWRVNRQGHRILKKLSRYAGIDCLFRYPNIIFLLAAKILLAIILILLIITEHQTFLPLLIISCIGLLMNLRSAQSNDGSDQMALLILIAAAAAEANRTVVSMACTLVFLVLQSSLAYGTSGFLKRKESGWLNGTFVVDILRTSTFGNRSVLKIAERYTIVAKSLGLLVVYGDCLLAFAFVMPPVVCIGILFFGIMLHIGIGYIMGLNTFLWSFGATYPAIYWLSITLYHYL